MNQVKRKRVMIIIIMMFILSVRCSAEAQTVLMYFIGSDLESDSASATNDLFEITQATKNSAVQVIAYLGGALKWWLPELENYHSYAMEIKQGIRTVLADFGEQESASAEQFGSFIKSYGKQGDDLIVWGHGFPENRGIGVDQLSPQDDILLLSEIQAGLSSNDMHFRLVGFDACRMATLEAAFVALPFASYFAASSVDESLLGWNYREVLSELSSSEENAPVRLKGKTLRGINENWPMNSLTVIDLNDFRKNVSFLNRVLDTAPLSQGQVLLSFLAASCADREAGKIVMGLLDDQDLFVTGISDDELILPDIQASYTSFVNRK